MSRSPLLQGQVTLPRAALPLCDLSCSKGLGRLLTFTLDFDREGRPCRSVAHLVFSSIRVSEGGHGIVEATPWLQIVKLCSASKGEVQFKNSLSATCVEDLQSALSKYKNRKVRSLAAADPRAN